ncbi:coagulation factor VII [Polymixia lowei]
MLLSRGWVLMFCILLISFTLCECKVFLEQSSAGQLLRSTRRRRANSFFLEEVLPGNLERECYEETCSQEEAAEIFQTREKTLEFWYRYTNLNPCLTNPCLNGGICAVDREAFLCLCPPQYHGKTCATDVLECRYRNGGCLQYCTDQVQTESPGVQCGCTDGYKLDPDGHSCSKTVEFPCGRKQNEAFYHSRSLWSRPQPSNTPNPNITMETDMLDLHSADLWVNTTEEESGGPGQNLSRTFREGGENGTEPWDEEREGGGMPDPRIVGGLLERQGGSPWQVLIRRADGYGFCGGTLVSERWVISAAHCFEEIPDHVTIGDYDKRRPDPGEQVIRVEKVVVHPHFHSYTFDSDIALVYLAQPVVLGPSAIPACLPDSNLAKYLIKEDARGMVTGWGAMQYLSRSSRFLRKVALPVVNQKKCMLSTEQVITDNMFCAGYLEANIDACSGDSGGPFVISYRGTWFLMGVVSWGEKCAAKGKYGVYTRLGNYLGWIQDTMQRQELNHTQS